ncbi:anthranilate synthase component II; anthranilate phosphoribosyltransferase [Salmonella enterica subsp. arizonae]|uniref:Anthranilate synthase component II anthranilate phosphoribosyltransferase n=1 Tax=Salmonella enterica subsp. arizonae TaxID=59203 RepID=A0A379SUM7_SALER|nr:anthranilate synthase component II; anthranilate phosphoribosyltransferase [Salmonella enterica subsp. arizonae]
MTESGETRQPQRVQQIGIIRSVAAFGINLDMNADKSRQALDELGVCFLFAPKYHTGFRHAMPVRQQLKTRTLFNVLGPLINPAHPPLALIGVYTPELVLPIAETLRVLGYQRAAVVHSGGMDEVRSMRRRLSRSCMTAKLKAINLRRRILA